MSDIDAEDRTQAPSKQRRILAREAGQVAQSRELTAAFGLLSATLVLLVEGPRLGSALLEIVREPLIEGPIETVDPTHLVLTLRRMAIGLAWPFVLTVLGYVLGAFTAHQAQVHGLWAPALLAPDLGRLTSPWSSQILKANALRGTWALLKGVAVAALAAWTIRHEWPNLPAMADLSVPEIVTRSGGIVVGLLARLSTAIVALGVVDYAFAHHRFEASLRTTPGQQRQELRSTDGDPALRARRRQIAKAWRLDSVEILTGATLMITGPSDLTIIFGGGPPPRKVNLRSVVDGAAGRQLRHTAQRSKTPLVTVDNPNFACRIAKRSPPNQPLSPELLNELASIWPS